MLQNGIFLFQIQKMFHSVEPNEKTLPFGEYHIKYCTSTPMIGANIDDRELYVYGYAVDVRNGDNVNLAEKILQNSNTIDDVLACEYYLGGKYLLFYHDKRGMYVIPDATASVPFCYSVGTDRLICSSNGEMIAKELSLTPNARLSKIRNKSEISQAMPYNVTIYKEVEQLLPNHYFLLSEGKSVRVVISKEKQTVLSAKDVADKTSAFIEVLLDYYKSIFTIYCPITSGRDSRVILAYLLAKKGANQIVDAYTINHGTFSENEPDILIPRQIAEKFDIEYTQLADLEPTNELQEIFNKEFGKTDYSKRTLMIANTIKTAYGNGAILNGDIIGQVGKCSLHRDIPAFLATPRYFRCKLHNYSKESLYYLKKWIKDIHNSNEQVNLFDLFSIENRMGRWAAQENLIYNMMGQLYLNIFNSRAIIYEWTRVPRKERKLSKIHLELIKQKFHALIYIPFEPESRLVKLAKLNGVSYYLSSFAKYYVEKIRFFRDQK